MRKIGGSRRTIGASKGQAALEYILTYGWGFLVILVTIGALSYFGFFNPQRYVPDRCYFGSQLVCEDYYVAESGIIHLYLRNDFGKDIVIKSASVDGSPDSTLDSEVTIPSGGVEEVLIDNVFVVPGEKNDFVISLSFSKSQSTIPGNTPPIHNIVGTLTAAVGE